LPETRVTELDYSCYSMCLSVFSLTQLFLKVKKDVQDDGDYDDDDDCGGGDNRDAADSDSDCDVAATVNTES